MKVGIIGAGQLGRMLALAGYPLGISCTFLDPDANSSGGQVGRVLTGAIDDPERIGELAEQVDVLTFDIENIPVEVLDRIAARARIYPPPAALAVAQDRLSEKRLFEAIGIATAPYAEISTDADLATCAARLGWPVVLKARTLGYDGRGQRVVHELPDLAPAWHSLCRVPAIAEGWVRFERELSLVGVRGADKTSAYYPLAENVHEHGILYSTIAPYEDAALQRQAEQYLEAIFDRFDYRGVLTVEFFLADGKLIANEIAPRVHNSGHWTIEGAETSQFENHLRAILGLPLGSTAAVGHAAMINLLGKCPEPAQLLGIPGLHLHDYGKSPRPQRKLGHCTLVAADRLRVLERFETLRSIVTAQ
jgi:5-(carboxyamino)imidazole ribonucleotide synthase